MAKVKLLIDTDILIDYLKGIKPARELFASEKYGEKPDSIVDYIIAATAWSKKLPLLTRNRKHFEYIKEIRLSPGYEIE